MMMLMMLENKLKSHQLYNLDDGLQHILVINWYIIPVTCNNGWTMLNGVLTPNIYDYLHHIQYHIEIIVLFYQY